jgi:hypothetical protein
MTELWEFFKPLLMVFGFLLFIVAFNWLLNRL